MQRFPKSQFSFAIYALCSTLCATLVLGLAMPVEAKSKAKKKQRTITKPEFDPSAEKVELFEAMKEKQIETKVVAQDEFHGKVFIENKTDKPLTILLPDSFVAVPVHAQFGGGGGQFGGGGGQFGGQGGQFGGQGGGGQSQPSGGGFGGQFNGGGGGFGGGGVGGAGGGGLNPGGGGFFSIPPERVVSIPFKSVCLAHGLKAPTPRLKMKMIPTEEFTKDKNLQELLIIVSKSRLDKKVLQAAVWHITNKMSWQTLARKSVNHIGTGARPYFSRKELIAANNVVAFAVKQVKEKATKEGKKKEEKKQLPIRLRNQRVTVR